MKTLIIYDSLYGNTQKIAEAIGQSIGGETTILSVKQFDSSKPLNFNLLIVGSPTHAGRPTVPIQLFVKNLPLGSLKNIAIAAFGTGSSATGESLFIKFIMWLFGYAAKHIQKGLKLKGGMVLTDPVDFLVKGKEGPIIEGEIERAKKWGSEIMQKFNQS